MQKLVFVGTLSGPVCGELNCNRVVKEGFLSRGYDMSFVDTYTGDRTPSLSGKFSLHKLRRVILIQLKLLSSLSRGCVVYATPGLSWFGYLRFGLIALTAKVFGAKVIFHYHGSRIVNEYDQYGLFQKTCIRLIARLVRHHIFLTPSLMRDYKNIFPRIQCSVVYNFFDADLREYWVNSSGFLRSDTSKIAPLKVLFISNIIESKGYKLAISILDELVDRGVDVRFQIAGTGTDESVECLRNILKTCSFEYEYLGSVSGEKKYELFVNNDILLFPTLYPQEGLPLVILEAMITNTVVVTNPIGGIPDLVNDKETGFLLEKDNIVESGADVLEMIAKSPDKAKSIRDRALHKAEALSEKSFKENVIACVESFRNSA